MDNGQGFRMSAISALKQQVKVMENKQVRYNLLIDYLERNPPQEEVEELIWSLVTSRAGSYYH